MNSHSERVHPKYLSTNHHFRRAILQVAAPLSLFLHNDIGGRKGTTHDDKGLYQDSVSH